MRFARRSKLEDCELHGAGSELFIVEGDSAADSVAGVRNHRFQAVLPIQGKPLNATKASRKTVLKNDKLQTVITALGVGWDHDIDLSAARYERVIILTDPDVDGVHIEALLLLFFHRWMRRLLDANMLFAARPPLWLIESPELEKNLLAYSDEHFHRLHDDLNQRGIVHQRSRFRGLGNLPPALLEEVCVDPKTRRLAMLSADDAEACLESFKRLRAMV